MSENGKEMNKICAKINLLVEAKMNDFKKLRFMQRLDKNAHVALKSKLDEIENCIYFWIALIFLDLNELARHSKDKVFEVIKRIPLNIYKQYEKILSKSSNTEEARRLLYIVCAAAQSLTLVEMNWALSIKNKDYLNAPFPSQSFVIYVRYFCDFFIRIQNSRIYLIHQTAKEFLMRGSTFSESVGFVISHERPWKSSLEPTESHYLFTQICMSYFFSSKFESDSLNMKGKSLQRLSKSRFIDEYATKYEFLKYAARQWVTHFNQVENNQTKLCKLALETSLSKWRSHVAQSKTWADTSRLCCCRASLMSKVQSQRTQRQLMLSGVSYQYKSLK